MATTKPLVIVMMMTNLPVDWCLSFMVMVKVIVMVMVKVIAMVMDGCWDVQVLNCVCVPV